MGSKINTNYWGANVDPAKSGDNIGDFAALAVAAMNKGM